MPRGPPCLDSACISPTDSFPSAVSEIGHSHCTSGDWSKECILQLIDWDRLFALSVFCDKVIHFLLWLYGVARHDAALDLDHAFGQLGPQAPFPGF